ncbi:hypothetical protein DPMN_116368 [Dreissena polymorpha]|uniref:Uncharacterized protein n=1 Tax=Dreissena polymorpha TaxID=45954 RepID=A0A9D4QTH4_DREPO|nr:hypothetical protein DPMN_116368 [Dreissena polymorpha]
MLKQNFGWAWSMWAGAPGLVMGPCIVEIDRIVIRDVQYHFEVNRCRNEEVNVKKMALQRPTRLIMGPCIVEIDRIVIRDFQGSSAYSDGRKTEITTISPLFLPKAWG